MLRSRTFVVAMLALIPGVLCWAQDRPVTLAEDDAVYTLDNGIVTAKVAKASGDLVSLRFKNLEMLATFTTEDGQPDLKKDPPGENRAGLNASMTDHQYGFWSHDSMGPRGTGDATARITIDPRSNDGQRAEVSVKGISGGRLMGTGPGAGNPGNFIADIEIRFAMERGQSGVYTYCQFAHTAEYAASTITEARFCAKLADFFDWMSIGDDEHHNKHYPASLREGDKYIYTTNQFNNRAFGWSSTTKNVGFFLINPSMEYMSGGPTKIEFLGHRDTNAVAAPCVLNYWRSSHYGGAEVAVAEGEQWTKVIGPFMLYVNSAGDSQAIYRDAKAQAVVQQQKWPFDWVSGVDYPGRSGRATVKGQLVLNDTQALTGKLPNLMVGLTAPAYISAAAGFGGGARRQVDWQQDAKHYEFWVRGQENGRFEIPYVRPGTYTLHAFADGVLGEFARTDVTIAGGQPVDLGQVSWTPVRKGKQIWEIGIPNRNGSEFFKADEFWQPTIGQTFATLFPDDITYVIGKSDFAKDWFFQHVPRFDEEMSRQSAANAPARGARRGGGPTSGPAPAVARGRAPTTGPITFGGFFGPPAMGKSSTRTIVFTLANAPHGTATLRAAFSGTGVRTLPIKVNDADAGQFDRMVPDGVLDNHGSHGIWHENEVSFDASLLKPGQNTLKLIVPDGNVRAGVIYDYLRLELSDQPMKTASAGQ